MTEIPGNGTAVPLCKIHNTASQIKVPLTSAR